MARCALSTCCNRALRHTGSTARQATATLARATTAQQNELLFQQGTNFNDQPTWQRRGVGLHIDRELPVKDEYRAMVTAAPAARPLRNPTSGQHLAFNADMSTQIQGQRLLAEMPLHAITTVHGPRGLRERLAVEIADFTDRDRVPIEDALDLAARLQTSSCAER